MGYAVWTNDPVKARSNKYGSVCPVCQEPVEPGEGYMVSTAREDEFPERTKAVHLNCDPVNSKSVSLWFYRACPGFGMSLAEVREAQSYIGVEPVKEEETTPEPESLTVREPTEAELAQAVEELLNKTTANFLEQVPGLVRATLAEMTRSVEIKVGSAPKVKVQNSHKALPDIVTCVAAGTNPFLVGPAGSGKTTLAQQVANVLKREFYAENRVTSEYKLLGYMDATGKYVGTQFRKAYEKGGVFLLDEVDASDPDVLTTFNSALANGLCPFPDKLVKAHKDFVALAAGNTYGRGADRQYVGRNQLDAATLDRFVIVEIDYDEAAELSWANDDDWTTYVQSVRKAVEQEQVRHIVSPRASIFGARLLAAGMERDLVIERCIWKGLDATNRQRVMQRLGGVS